MLLSLLRPPRVHSCEGPSNSKVKGVTLAMSVAALRGASASLSPEPYCWMPS